MAQSFTDAFLIPSALSSAAHAAPADSSWQRPVVDFPAAAPAPSPSPAAAAASVLDAIDAAGKDGASASAIALITGHPEAFIEEVLGVLKTNRMVEISAEAGVARLTDFGAKARYLITR